MINQDTISAYEYAKKLYASIGVDADEAMKVLASTPISIHCWQGDDVGGFEKDDKSLSGGIAVTGSYPGRAKTPEQLRADLSFVLSLVPGTKKVSLHASYLETDGKVVDRSEVLPEHFARWVSWAKEKGVGLDFNPTFFSHPKAADGFTLSHQDEGIRKFWVEHGKACRKIAEYIGKELGQQCVTNFWIPDGYKDNPVDRYAPRKRLEQSLDEIFEEKIDPKYNIDCVESKLFGIGSESYVVGSHEFYLAYAVKNNVPLTLDVGHFHPTETVSNKLSSLFCFMDHVLLHVSRPVRWDSDHVVILDDETAAIMADLVRGGYLNKTFIALDYFDASINRTAAWVIGARNTQKALLKALLEPVALLKDAERSGDLTTRLALTEEYKAYPWNAVWDYFCEMQSTPVRESWLAEVKAYETDVLLKR